MDSIAQLPNSISSPSVPIHALADQYEFRNFGEIQEYLGARLFLIDVLLEAKTQIEKIFGTGTVLILDLVHFNDYPNSQQLFVKIATKLCAEKSYPLLTRFDEEWWLDASEKAHHELNFTLEYV